MPGPYSLLPFSLSGGGVKIPSEFFAEESLNAVCGNPVLIEYEALFSGALQGSFVGRHGETAKPSYKAYSLLRYSINPGERSGIKTEHVFVETLNAVAGSAVPIHAEMNVSGTLTGELRCTVSVNSEFIAPSELFADAEMNANICEEPEFSEKLQQTSAGSKNIWLSDDYFDELKSNTYGSKNIYMNQMQTLQGTLLGRLRGSKNIRYAAVLSDVLMALPEAVTQETDTLSITIAIPPGGEVRIDSDTYRVTLNGQNILYAQSGDWVFVSRDLLRLNIESTTGGSMSGNMIYTERYL